MVEKEINIQKDKLNKLIEDMNYDFSKSEIQKQSEKIDRLIVDYIKCL